MEHLLLTAGLGLLFAFVMLESAGIPLPGETALIAASILAVRGRYEIWQVIVIASAAAIIGDNGGYWVGRIWGRKLLTKWKRLEQFSERVLPRAERFFEAHGGKTVFIGRFVAILRFTAAWLAGVTRMEWWRFLLWNAAGGICWATGVGLLAYYGGKAAADAFDHYGLIGAGAIIGLGVIGVVGFHLWRRRMLPDAPVAELGRLSGRRGSSPLPEPAKDLDAGGDRERDPEGDKKALERTVFERPAPEVAE